jgi:hypothetical protein
MGDEVWVSDVCQFGFPNDEINIVEINIYAINIDWRRLRHSVKAASAHTDFRPAHGTSSSNPAAQPRSPPHVPIGQQR